MLLCGRAHDSPAAARGPAAFTRIDKVRLFSPEPTAPARPPYHTRAVGHSHRLRPRFRLAHVDRPLRHPAVASRASLGRLSMCGRPEPRVERRCAMLRSKGARARVHAQAEKEEWRCLGRSLQRKRPSQGRRGGKNSSCGYAEEAVSAEWWLSLAAVDQCDGERERERERELYSRVKAEQ